jgi:hypothetical protein
MAEQATPPRHVRYRFAALCEQCVRNRGRAHEECTKAHPACRRCEGCGEPFVGQCTVVYDAEPDAHTREVSHG